MCTYHKLSFKNKISGLIRVFKAGGMREVCHYHTGMLELNINNESNDYKKNSCFTKVIIVAIY